MRDWEGTLREACFAGCCFPEDEDKLIHSWDSSSVSQIGLSMSRSLSLVRVRFFFASTWKLFWQLFLFLCGADSREAVTQPGL
jgi:hypothetical protein